MTFHSDTLCVNKDDENSKTLRMNSGVTIIMMSFKNYYDSITKWPFSALHEDTNFGHKLYYARDSNIIIVFDKQSLFFLIVLAEKVRNSILREMYIVNKEVPVQYTVNDQ